MWLTHGLSAACRTLTTGAAPRLESEWGSHDGEPPVGSRQVVRSPCTCTSGARGRYRFSIEPSVGHEPCCASVAGCRPGSKMLGGEARGPRGVGPLAKSDAHALAL